MKKQNVNSDSFASRICELAVAEYISRPRGGLLSGMHRGVDNDEYMIAAIVTSLTAKCPEDAKHYRSLFNIHMKEVKNELGVEFSANRLIALIHKALYEASVQLSNLNYLHGHGSSYQEQVRRLRLHRSESVTADVAGTSSCKWLKLGDPFAIDSDFN